MSYNDPWIILLVEIVLCVLFPTKTVDVVCPDEPKDCLFYKGKMQVRLEKEYESHGVRKILRKGQLGYYPKINNMFPWIFA